LFVDTTGLTADDHLIGVTCKVGGGPTIHRRFYSERPANPINGYDPQTWDGEDISAEGLSEFVGMIEGRTLAGHNLYWHVARMCTGLDALGVRRPSGTAKHIVDLMSLFAPLRAHGIVDGVSMDALCTAFGIHDPGVGSGAQLRKAMALYDEYMGLLLAGVGASAEIARLQDEIEDLQNEIQDLNRSIEDAAYEESMRQFSDRCT
jgi:hypothetical protein